MIEIPAGEIVLRDEGTRATWRVEIQAFRLATHPVTWDLYHTVLGVSPNPCGARTPVTDVSWRDAVQFCNLLSQQMGLRPCYRLGDEPEAGKPDTADPAAADPDAEHVTCDWHAGGYRLPLESEWEYACRAGTSGVRYGELDEIGWYRANSAEHVHEVATKAPNPWGLYDMIGNVWEWCWDVYDPEVYGPYRVFRGGGWADEPRGCRASCRRKSHPTYRMDDLGFRLARSGTADVQD